MIEDIQNRLQNSIKNASQVTEEAVKSEALKAIYESEVCPIHDARMKVEIRAIGGFELSNVCCDEHFEKMKAKGMEFFKQQLNNTLKSF